MGSSATRADVDVEIAVQLRLTEFVALQRRNVNDGEISSERLE